MATFGDITFTNTASWTMTYKLASTYGNLTLSGKSSGPVVTTFALNASLMPGSFPSSVIGTKGHPADFAPSPQTLTEPASYLSYFCPASDLAATDPKLGYNGNAKSPSAGPFRMASLLK